MNVRALSNDARRTRHARFVAVNNSWDVSIAAPLWNNILPTCAMWQYLHVEHGHIDCMLLHTATCHTQKKTECVCPNERWQTGFLFLHRKHSVWKRKIPSGRVGAWKVNLPLVYFEAAVMKIAAGKVGDGSHGDWKKWPESRTLLFICFSSGSTSNERTPCKVTRAAIIQTIIRSLQHVCLPIDFQLFCHHVECVCLNKWWIENRIVKIDSILIIHVSFFQMHPTVVFQKHLVVLADR